MDHADCIRALGDHHDRYREYVTDTGDHGHALHMSVLHRLDQDIRDKEAYARKELRKRYERVRFRIEGPHDFEAMKETCAKYRKFIRQVTIASSRCIRGRTISPLRSLPALHSVFLMSEEVIPESTLRVVSRLKGVTHMGSTNTHVPVFSADTSLKIYQFIGVERLPDLTVFSRRRPMIKHLIFLGCPMDRSAVRNVSRLLEFYRAVGPGPETTGVVKVLLSDCPVTPRTDVRPLLPYIAGRPK